MPLDYVLGEPITEQRGGCLVRLADSAQKCVVFLGPPNGDDIHLAGTGFLVSEGKPRSPTYLVTVAHVARALHSPIGVRLNTYEGEFRVEPVDRAEWSYHSNPAVDVAVTVFDVPPWADTVPFRLRSFATQFKMGTKNFGPGDFSYVVGLYRLLGDTRRNIPLVHTGHIAATALDHPLPVNDRLTGKTVATRAYLVESRAISGASGSPVFVRRSIEHLIPESVAVNANKIRASTPGSVWLLGMWIGSWGGDPDQLLIEAADADPNLTVSLGIGLVVPAFEIIDVLMSPEVREQCERWRGARDGRAAVTQHAALPTKDENPRHKEDFNRLLGAAVKSPK